MDVDASGNVLVAGYFVGGPFDLGAGPLGPAPGYELFVGKLSPAGQALWSKDLGAGQVVWLATDTNGAALVTGGPPTAPNVWVRKIAGDGTPQWTATSVTSGAGTSNNLVDAIAVDGGGRSFITGRYAGEIDFGSGAVTAIADAVNFYLAAFDASGTNVWTRSVASTATGSPMPWWEVVQGMAVTTDPQGNVYVTGYYSGTADFGDGALPAVGPDPLGEAMFVAKLDASGNTVWSRGFPTQVQGWAHGTSIVVDGTGNVLVTADFNKPITFGGAVLQPATSDAGNALVELDASGNHVWSRSLSGTNGSAFARPTLLSGRIALTGAVRGTVDLGQGPITGDDTVEGSPFIAMLDASGNTLWSESFGGIGAWLASRGQCGELVLAGGFQAMATDFGCGSISPYSPSSNYDTMLAVRYTP